MFNRVTVDYITHTEDKAEYALYLVEDAPWENTENRVKVMQDRVYTALDAVLDGQLASDYPDSRGKKVRIEVVCRGPNPPSRFQEVVNRLNEIVNTTGDYKRDIDTSEVVCSLRVTYSERPSEAR